MRCAMFAAFSLGAATPALALQPPAAPAAAPAAADPARLAAAERLVALVMPEDAMRRMLSQGIPGMSAAMEMSAEELGLAEASGMSEADRGRSMADLASERDPHFRERTQIAMRVTTEAMSEMMAGMAPEMTRAYVSYFARRFTLAELNELVGLFSTPAARKYTESMLSLTEDPAFTDVIRAMMPRMVEASARLEERIRTATAHLPAPPPPPVNASESSNGQESED